MGAGVGAQAGGRKGRADRDLTAGYALAEDDWLFHPRECEGRGMNHEWLLGLETP